jgi:hypothetical protein
MAAGSKALRNYVLETNASCVRESGVVSARRAILVARSLCFGWEGMGVLVGWVIYLGKYVGGFRRSRYNPPPKKWGALYYLALLAFLSFSFT